MIDFINYFFSFFGSFVSMLFNRFIYGSGLSSFSLGNAFAGALILSYIIRFFIGGWFSKTFGGDDINGI